MIYQLRVMDRCEPALCSRLLALSAASFGDTPSRGVSASAAFANFVPAVYTSKNILDSALVAASPVAALTLLRVTAYVASGHCYLLSEGRSRLAAGDGYGRTCSLVSGMALLR